MSRQKKQKTFGQQLTQAMTERQVSSARLARRLQVTERTVARWRADDTEPSFIVKRAIAEALGIEEAAWLGAEQVAA